MIPYHPVRKYSTRPHNFRLAPDHPYSVGLHIAFLQQMPFTNLWRDSVDFNRNPAVAPTTGANDWYWLEDGYKWFTLAGNGAEIFMREPPPTTAATLMLWSKVSQVPLSSRSLLRGDPYPQGVYLHHATTDGLLSIGFFPGDGNADYQNFAQFPNYNASSGPIHVGLSTQSGRANGPAYINGQFLNTWATNGNPVNLSGSTGGNKCGSFGFSDEYSYRDIIWWDYECPAYMYERIGDPTNVMLDDWIQPITQETFFMPLDTGPPADLTGIFDSAIFNSDIIGG